MYTSLLQYATQYAHTAYYLQENNCLQKSLWSVSILYKMLSSKSDICNSLIQ